MELLQYANYIKDIKVYKNIIAADRYSFFTLAA